MSSGVACQCLKCSAVNWYEGGKCLVCGAGTDVEYTWIAKAVSGGNPEDAPADTLKLQAGVSDELIKIWTNLVLLRSLTPAQAGGPLHLGPRGFFYWRGMTWDISVSNPPSDLTDKINSAADWTNRAFVIRLASTFEAFADGKKPNKARLPNNPGMREFHHVRRLRNAAAHGDEMDDPKDVSEETQLFRGGGTPVGQCNLAINEVLEPMWARLLLYARSLENGAMPLPPKAAVVTVAKGKYYFTQSFEGKKELTLPDGDVRRQRRIGEVVPLDV